MTYGKFGFYNVLGGIAWVTICLLSGWFFGNLEWVSKHFEAVLIAIVVVSVMPMAVEFVLEWRRRRSGSASEECKQATEAA
jgi:membrane-associated protein